MTKVRSDQRQRILIAVAQTLTEHGYERTPVELTLRAAGISRRTFYDLFSGKAEAFWAAYEGARGSLFDHVRSSLRPGSEWPERLEATIASVCSWSAADRERALLVCGQSFTAGPHAARCHDALVAGFVSMLGRQHAGPPSVREEAVIGGIATLIADRLGRNDSASLDTLPPTLTSFVVAVYPSCR